MYEELLKDLELSYKKQNLKGNLTVLIDEHTEYELKKLLTDSFHPSINRLGGFPYKVIRNTHYRGAPLLALVPTVLLEALAIELILKPADAKYKQFYKEIR